MSLLTGIAIGIVICLVGVLANFARNEAWFKKQSAALDALVAKLPK